MSSFWGGVREVCKLCLNNFRKKRGSTEDEPRVMFWGGVREVRNLRPVAKFYEVKLC